jgi:hypothetical protein
MKAARTTALLSLADKMEPRMRNSFLRAVDEMKGNIDMSALVQSIENNDRVLSSIAIGDKAWAKVLAQSATIPTEMFSKAGDLGAAGLKNQFNISTSFTMKNPRAQAWARTNSSALITQINDQTRKGIQQVIGSAYELGLPSRETARVIREMVGLTEKQSAAVFNFRERLVAEGRKADQVARMTTKYEAKLLKYRSENIARTEIAKAGNEGLIESWRQAVDAGLLDPNNTNVEWLAAFDDRVCPICAPLNGTVYSYKDIESGKSAAPPAHPMCRCTLGISFAPVTASKPVAPTTAATASSAEDLAATTSDVLKDERINAAQSLLEIHQGSSGLERGIILDIRTGETLHDQVGEAHRIDIAYQPPVGVKTLDMHTHPNNSMFSDGDWGRFSLDEIQEMRVVAEQNIYSLAKTESYVNSDWKTRTVAKTKSRWNEILEEVASDNRFERELVSEQADAWIEEVNKRMASEFKVTLTTTPRNQ